jgi:hypothetical protein
MVTDEVAKEVRRGRRIPVIGLGWSQCVLLDPLAGVAEAKEEYEASLTDLKAMFQPMLLSLPSRTRNTLLADGRLLPTSQRGQGHRA